MKQVNVYQAKTQLSRLLQDALDGEEVIIARDGVPLVRLVPVAQSAGSLLGVLPGASMAPDFDEPLADFQGYQ